MKILNNYFKKIEKGIYKTPGHLSEEAKNLIAKMLVVYPEKKNYNKRNI